jgi:20S proteasome subunit alpha 3
MSRGYDKHTTTFSPDGRLLQVEYAMEAINKAGASVGLLTNEGLVLACEKQDVSALLE